MRGGLIVSAPVSELSGLGSGDILFTPWWTSQGGYTHSPASFSRNRDKLCPVGHFSWLVCRLFCSWWKWIVVTWNYFINIVGICHPSTRHGIIILAGLKLHIFTLVAAPVLRVTVITVPEGPTFAMKLDREENLTVLESGVCTAADKSRKKDSQRWTKCLKDQHEAAFHNCFFF